VVLIPDIFIQPPRQGHNTLKQAKALHITIRMLNQPRQGHNTLKQGNALHIKIKAYSAP
jgi:hypothetical protein